MTNFRSKNEKKSIWERITVEQLAIAIASLGDRSDELKKETWRLNAKTCQEDSVWSELIDRLKLDQNECTRLSLYNIWCRGRHEIKFLVEKQKAGTAENNLSLHSNPSLPLPQQPKTRPNQRESAHAVQTETSIVLTFNEWKSAFSCTHRKMKPYWTDMFYEKLTSCGFKCPVKFKTPYIKKGTRKQACSFFCCYAMCSISICTRKYQIILKQEPEENASVLFLVRITGKENHNINTEISARQLRGKNRILVGKQANEIGPLGVFREHVKNANESLLAAGNYTECETIETLKKAAYDYRKKMHVDEDIFKECRIIARAYLAADVTSTNVKDKSMTNDVGPSKASSEFIFGTIVDSPLKNSLHHSRDEPNVTNDQLSNDPSSQHSPQPETIIDGYTLRWPKFQIRSALFQG
ncbi:unnamed protein product [Didymodactylos carnosus]|uniref:Uncharacterized protein n=1 Tax=Didymodactylos carnosus TaxID=1234261 RepID=A0A8S2HHX0_9BILA|nr:unnamed protein product [Didymodactylos carnosus]CAF3626254.1 unnamed protein product [Didymodactylos carnosus]